MGYLYNDLCFYHLNEKDLNSILEYRRRTGGEIEDSQSQQIQTCETQTFALYSAQVPYLFLDHSQLANYRSTQENRQIFSSVEELDRSVSERNL